VRYPAAAALRAAAVVSARLVALRGNGIVRAQTAAARRKVERERPPQLVRPGRLRVLRLIVLLRRCQRAARSCWPAPPCCWLWRVVSRRNARSRAWRTPPMAS
jgi:hypothetical protein